ncbi:hypothetical protein [Saliphagus sp. LR7]|uniref:hypothetical protein n=1 Tax=Saliphagus sp. LR7 TaxID=2282654 RepID=UPI000DF85318|nr:hypothetical protein [Saliphagus sp. LR7]
MCLGAAVAQLVTAGSIGFSAFVLMFGAFFLSFGAAVTPAIRRRLGRRHSVTEFGHVRTVDRRVVREEEDEVFRCTACDLPAREGLVRRYREEYAVAGVPLYTESEGHNHYCLECASEELLGPREPTEQPDPEVERETDLH